MIIDQDIEKLKEVFATKEDLNKFVTRDEWRDQNMVIANEFKGLIQLMGEMEERLITRMDEKFAMQDKRFERMEQRFKENDEKFNKLEEKMDERFGKMDQRFKENDEKFYSLLNKMTEQYSHIFNQEKRIAKTEHKLFPTP